MTLIDIERSLITRLVYLFSAGSRDAFHMSPVVSTTPSLVPSWEGGYSAFMLYDPPPHVEPSSPDPPVCYSAVRGHSGLLKGLQCLS